MKQSEKDARRRYLTELALRDRLSRCSHCQIDLTQRMGCISILTDPVKPLRFCSDGCLKSYEEVASMIEASR